MTITRNFSILAPGVSSAGVVAVANGGTGVTSSTGTGSVVLSASPTFTGSPLAPTQSVADNSTKVATTAYADRVGCRVVDNTARGATGWVPATAQMCGFGASYAFTPTKTGNVLLSFVGWGNTAGAGVVRFAQGYYGTGTAPARTAAATGTAIGGGGVQDTGATTMSLSFAYYVSGLTLNTAYWFDIALTETGGAVDLTGDQFSAIEV